MTICDRCKRPDAEVGTRPYSVGIFWVREPMLSREGDVHMQAVDLCESCRDRISMATKRMLDDEFNPPLAKRPSQS